MQKIDISINKKQFSCLVGLVIVRIIARNSSLEDELDNYIDTRRYILSTHNIPFEIIDNVLEFINDINDSKISEYKNDITKISIDFKEFLKRDGIKIDEENKKIKEKLYKKELKK